MALWKAGGYVIKQYATDHDPPHVHVFRDGVEMARVTIPGGMFLTLRDERHANRILDALRQHSLID
jgi:hypothetical protein